MNTNHCRRDRIHPGDLVAIVLKKDQPTGKLTRGIVGRLLTNKGYHPRGIKVMLTDGQVGRVQHICGLASLEQEPGTMSPRGRSRGLDKANTAAVELDDLV